MKIKKEIDLAAEMDSLLTEALIALEERDYLKATALAQICLGKTQWIEQRMACASLLTTAAAKSEKVTEYYLNLIYKED